MQWKLKDYTQWHRWFAWHPRVIDDRCVWLEYVERRMVGSYPCGMDTYCEWEFRIIREQS